MTEASASVQTGQLPRKANESRDKARGNTESSAVEVQTAAAGSVSTANLKARKRTKTGCLTCRRRRIKCGEERPTCKNCVKSKRDCEGYIPRVIFKDPLGAFHRGQPGLAVRSPNGSGHNGAAGIYETMQSAPPETPIAPRLPVFMEQPGSGQGAPGDYYGVNGYEYHRTPHSMNSEALLQQHIPHNVFPNGDLQHTFKLESLPEPQSNSMSYPPLERQSTWEGDSAIEMGYNDLPTHWSHGSEPATARSANFPSMFVRNPTLPSPAGAPQSCPWTEVPARQYPDEQPLVASHAVPGYYGVNRIKVQDDTKPQIDPQYQFYGPPAQIPWMNEPDDDYFDVDSDDEDYDIKSAVDWPVSYNVGSLIAMSASQSNGGMRSMTNFLNEPNVLATYQPSYAASPLMDPQTARIFCHFITATAPTLAVCERRPSNPAAIFSGLPVPKSERALWSYTLPMLALSHQGLLHAMLALASLHIAKLQHTSTTPSLKHYHHALRRIAKALGNSKKRRHVATLAATLLLGFYEVTTAEHNKWNSHLSGARELVMDIDFAGMARKIENHRRRQEEAEANSRYHMHNGYPNGYHQFYPPTGLEDFPSREDRQLDENLISTLVGYRLKYNQYGQIIDYNDPPPESEPPLTAQDVENFEIQCDLFWWYAKHDMIQSLVSRNRLLLSYDRWSLCPPRAPIGRLDAVYGSLDHLLLLMGRLVDFAGKDLPRKLRAQKEGEKRSRSQPSSMGIPTTQPSPQQGPPSSMQPPPMYGMMPDPGHIRVPSGFDQAQHDRMYTAPVPSEDKSLDIATHEAGAEWAAISHAFDVYFDSLGPAYAPLEPEHMTPMATPFGPALYYRSYAIACILNMYFCGRIVCMRVRPNMPPASMVAAGVAARSTAHYANTIGRIVGGIQPVDNTASINPSHGAALIDCCMGFFHAGIQYTDPGQRGWTVARLRDIARLTGWQTSALIASGCERAWSKAAEMGRGPPYTAVMQHAAKDDRVAGRGRDPRDLQQPAKDNNDRRFITVNAGTRVHWAIGLLGVEEDMQGMKLD